MSSPQILLLLSLSSIHHLSYHLSLSLFEYSGVVLIFRCTAGQHGIRQNLEKLVIYMMIITTASLTGSTIIHDLSFFYFCFLLRLLVLIQKKNVIAVFVRNFKFLYLPKCKNPMLVYHSVPHAETEHKALYHSNMAYPNI